MKLEGIWKVKEMTCFGEDGAFWRSAGLFAGWMG